MTTFSKQFSERAKNLTCKDYFHPDFESCLSFLRFVLSRSVIRGLTFLGPIILVPLIIKLRKTNINEWKESTEIYLKTVFSMSCVVTSALCAHCFLNKIFKEIRFYNLAAIPAFFGIVSFLNYFPPKFTNMHFVVINNLLVQAVFRTSSFKVFRIVRESKTLSTVLFMLLSSLIMGLTSLTAGEKHRYWYAKNNQVIKNEDDLPPEIREKKVLLKELIYEQMMSTANVGLLVSSIKILSNSIKLLKESIPEFINSFIQNFDYKLLGFFVAFQVLYFWLNNISNKTKRHRNSFLAGLLAGTAFSLSPRYFLFTYGFTAFVELLMLFSLKQLDQSSKIRIFLKNVPWVKVFICISVPTFAHWVVVYPWMNPKFINELIQVVSNDRLGYGARNYAKYILGI